MKKFYKYFTIVALWFLTLNIVLIPVISHFFAPKYVFYNSSKDIRDMAQLSISEMKKIYVGESDEEINKKRYYMQTKYHNSLSFCSRVHNNECYVIGSEGCRSTPDLERNNVTMDYLQSGNAVFVFGGSTTFGQGVSFNETWPYYYSQINNDSVLNFAVCGYAFIDDINKLIYLLKKGYVPKYCIFLEGLNDIWYNSSNNYSVHDQFSRYGKRFSADTFYFKHIFNSSSRKAIMDNLPVTIFLKYLRGSFNFNIDNIKFNKSAQFDDFNYNEAYFIAMNNPAIFSRHEDILLEKNLEYYRSNIDFLKKIAQSYSFEVYIFYQPIGALDLSNPFIAEKNDYVKSLMYNQFQKISSHVISSVRSGELDMIDMSDSLNDVASPRYVDLSHYSKFSNKVIADTIHKSIKFITADLVSSTKYMDKKRPEKIN